MIQRIKKVKNFGILGDNFINSQLPEFKQYNLIYGWNASGKTTLSRLFRCFEIKKKPDEFHRAEFELKLQNEKYTNITETCLENLPHIRVFNTDFINENVFRQDNDNQKPIYYLGEESIEHKKELDRLKKECKERVDSLSETTTKLETSEWEKKDLSQAEAKLIKESVRTEGADDYTNYNKSKFVRNIEHIDKDHLNDLSDEELIKKQTTIRQSIKNEINKISTPNLFTSKHIKGINEILTKEIVSEIIDKLEHNENLNHWVKEGLELHQNVNICHFCEQEIPKERFKKLKKHFNQDYKQLMGQIKILTNIWESLKFEQESISKDSFYSDVKDRFVEAENELKKEIKRYNNFLEKGLEVLKKKQENPFQKIEEVECQEFKITKLIKEINDVIEEHNQQTTNFSTKRLKIKKEIEQYFFFKCFSKYNDLKNKIQELSSKKEEKKKELDELDEKLKSLSLSSTDFKIPVKKLNKDLERFLGRNELIFEVDKENKGYYIKRTSTNQIAKSISEGEKTSIALIYFLAKLKEANFNLSNGIVVLDDPISSFDSNSIFQACGFIKSNTKGAKQVFILTHNFQFFKYVKHWFKATNESEFFMFKNIADRAENERRKSKLTPLDRLLKDYDSEYHYLFGLLYKFSQTHLEDSHSLEEIYPFPNIARKFLEVFLLFKFPAEKKLESAFSKAKEKSQMVDGSQIEAIKKFVNEYSHTNLGAIGDWDISKWSEAQEIINNIMKLVKDLDKEHFEGLKTSH